MDYAEYYVSTSRKRRTSSFVLLLGVGVLFFFYAISASGTSAFSPLTLDSEDALTDYFSRTTDHFRPFARASFSQVTPLQVLGTELAGDSAIHVSAGFIGERPVLIAYPARDNPDGPPSLVRRADPASIAVLHLYSDDILRVFSERTGEDASVLSPVFSEPMLFFDRGEPTHAASTTLMIFGAGLFFSCLVYVLSIRLCPEERTYFIRRLSALGPPVEMRALLNREMKSPVLIADSGDLTNTFIIGVRRGGFDIDFSRNLVLAYALKTPQRERVSGRTPSFAVLCRFMDGRGFYLLSEDTGGQAKVLESLKDLAPHALFDDPERLKSEWKRDPQPLIQQAKARRDGA